MGFDTRKLQKTSGIDERALSNFDTGRSGSSKSKAGAGLAGEDE
jgi:hypothetical protein